MTVQFSYSPPADESPRQRLQPYENTVGIPVLSFTKVLNLDVIELSFDPRNPENTIRYLRELASTATDLAAKVEDAIGGGLS